MELPKREENKKNILTSVDVSKPSYLQQGSNIPFTACCLPVICVRAEQHPWPFCWSGFPSTAAELQWHHSSLCAHASHTGNTAMGIQISLGGCRKGIFKSCQRKTKAKRHKVLLPCPGAMAAEEPWQRDIMHFAWLQTHCQASFTLISCCKVWTAPELPKILECQTWVMCVARIRSFSSLLPLPQGLLQRYSERKAGSC